MTAPGLCAACAHARPIENRRGSIFWLCGLAATDRRFPRYPMLPVLRCAGFRPAARESTMEDRTADHPDSEERA